MLRSRLICLPTLPCLSRPSQLLQRSLTRHASTRKTVPPAQHDSMESFFTHANTSKLDVKSTVYRGTLYEYTVLETLRNLSVSLHRTGGRDDKGIDLSGTWHLGDLELPIIVQCKNENKKIAPRYIRELCGIARQDTFLAIASVQTYSEKSLQSFMRAERPIVLFVIDTYEAGGTLRQLIWNAEADKFISGLEVRQAYEGSNVMLRVLYEGKQLKARTKEKR